MYVSEDVRKRLGDNVSVLVNEATQEIAFVKDGEYQIKGKYISCSSLARLFLKYFNTNKISGKYLKKEKAVLFTSWREIK